LQVNLIVGRYLDETSLSLRDFAEFISDGISDNVSHAAVHNWRKGINQPGTGLLCEMAGSYQDWRRAFALECLRAKHPQLIIEVGGGNGKSEA